MNVAAFLLTNKYQTGLLAGQSYGGLLPSFLVTQVPEEVTIKRVEELLSLQGIGMNCFDGSFNSFSVLAEIDWPREVSLNSRWAYKCKYSTLLKGAQNEA